MGARFDGRLLHEWTTPVKKHLLGGANVDSGTADEVCRARESIGRVESQSSPSILASARDLAFVLAILAFFAGFQYRHYYYGYLHIPTATFSIVDNSILVGSYSVFLSHRWYIIIGFAAVFALMLLTRFIKVPKASLAYGRLALLFVLLASFQILNTWAQETAGWVFTDFVGRQTAPQKPIIVTQEGKLWNPSITYAMQKGCVELITQSTDMLYVLVRQTIYPYVYVAAIPMRSIAHWITPLDYPGGNYAKRCIPS
jgi:hypothetical protein